MELLTLFAALSVFAALASVLWLRRGGHRELVLRSCPDCATAMIQLDGPQQTPGRSYELFACPTCDHVQTTIHGTLSLFAYCPQCRQLGLQMTCRQTHHEILQVHLEEHCHLCGFHSSANVPPAVEGPVVPGRGKVIRFPSEEERSARHTPP